MNWDLMSLPTSVLSLKNIPTYRLLILRNLKPLPSGYYKNINTTPNYNIFSNFDAVNLIYN